MIWGVRRIGIYLLVWLGGRASADIVEDLPGREVHVLFFVQHLQQLPAFSVSLLLVQILGGFEVVLCDQDEGLDTYDHQSKAEHDPPCFLAWWVVEKTLNQFREGEGKKYAESNEDLVETGQSARNLPRRQFLHDEGSQWTVKARTHALNNPAEQQSFHAGNEQ